MTSRWLKLKRWFVCISGPGHLWRRAGVPADWVWQCARCGRERFGAHR